jgi:hypothetical protein
MEEHDLIATMRSERAKWRALISNVGQSVALQSGVVGEWSLKDVVAHVTAYERGLVEWLAAASRGQAFVFADLGDPDLDGRNARIRVRSVADSFATVLRESGGYTSSSWMRSKRWIRRC